MNSLAVVVLDSLRYDVLADVVGEMPTLSGLGVLERRWSYATWTGPSHYNLLSGLLPHTGPVGMPASAYYRQSIQHLAGLLGLSLGSMADLAPSLWLPTYLRERGYYTGAYTSLPVLSAHTGIAKGFGFFVKGERHNDAQQGLVALAGWLRQAAEDGPATQPGFWLFNLGETHYPYTHHGDARRKLPHVSGWHGTVRSPERTHQEGPDPLDEVLMRELRERQGDAAVRLDSWFAALFQQLHPGTRVVVTADHGELFGEAGCHGHGPFFHEKLMEVPYIEGVVG